MDKARADKLLQKKQKRQRKKQGKKGKKDKAWKPPVPRYTAPRYPTDEERTAMLPEAMRSKVHRWVRATQLLAQDSRESAADDDGASDDDVGEIDDAELMALLSEDDADGGSGKQRKGRHIVQDDLDDDDLIASVKVAQPLPRLSPRLLARPLDGMPGAPFTSESVLLASQLELIGNSPVARGWWGTQDDRVPSSQTTHARVLTVGSGAVAAWAGATSLLNLSRCAAPVFASLRPWHTNRPSHLERTCGSRYGPRARTGSPCAIRLASTPCGCASSVRGGCS